MANWLFTTPTTTEAPFAWVTPLDRYRMDRGYTVKQTAPGPNYQLVRYDSFTNELGSANLPSQPSDPQIQPTGLNTFRGGYEWIVSDATKADLINSGIGITNANFTPAP